MGYQACHVKDMPCERNDGIEKGSVAQQGVLLLSHVGLFWIPTSLCWGIRNKKKWVFLPSL